MSSAAIAFETKFDAFLYTVIRQEDSGAFLSVLSLLARQGVDPWDEAADFMRLPRESAVTKLLGLLSGAVGNSLPQRDLRAEAVALLELLPQPSSIAAERQLGWLEIVRRLQRLRSASQAWIRKAFR